MLCGRGYAQRIWQLVIGCYVRPGLALAFACVFSSRTSPATLLCQRAVVPSPRAEEVLVAMSIEIRKLSREEAAGAFPKRGQMDLSAYTAALADLTPGDAAVVDLDGTTSRAMKRRLGQAATQLGYRLRWARQSDPAALHFEVLPTRARSSGAPRGRRGQSLAPSTASGTATGGQRGTGRAARAWAHGRWSPVSVHPDRPRGYDGRGVPGGLSS